MRGSKICFLHQMVSGKQCTKLRENRGEERSGRTKGRDCETVPSCAWLSSSYTKHNRCEVDPTRKIRWASIPRFAFQQVVQCEPTMHTQPRRQASFCPACPARSTMRLHPPTMVTIRLKRSGPCHDDQLPPGGSFVYVQLKGLTLLRQYG